jgi:hypothetical protein
LAKVLLNETHFDLNINFLIYEEINPKGKIKRFSWVSRFKLVKKLEPRTDIPLSEQTLEIVMRGGRARWRIDFDV